ncbi:MAG: Hsp20/alpha crystallin family protein [Lachnospiraceae bacterium]|jgi:HSP20 family molecular chaperone IbpA|nr:Hsp20/alpha crystallin family protein [Lachnospiraceae bacterium]
MMMPSIFGENLFDDFFDNSFRDYSGTQELMKTDVKENENDFEIDMSLPGVNKEDIKAELNDGYLTVSASTSNVKEDNDEKKRYVRRERYYGSCSRSFYVGDQVKQDEIKARYENGVLSLNIPKKEEKKTEVEQNNYIAIEG